MKPSFSEASFLEFRRVFKRDFYAYLYGSYPAMLLSNDMHACYMMGGEL